MILYLETGNIFKIEGVNNYAHGCNCAGAMGKGIALEFKMKFPKMYKEYKSLCEMKKFTLGSVFSYNYGEGYVFNLGTQTSWKTKANIKAIEDSLEGMLSFASKKSVSKIALPKIGAGLGGLKWAEVKNVIEKVASKYPDIDLFVVENYDKTSE